MGCLSKQGAWVVCLAKTLLQKTGVIYPQGGRQPQAVKRAMDPCSTTRDPTGFFQLLAKQGPVLPVHPRPHHK